MSAYLELGGWRFRQGFGEASFSWPPGTDVKKRRKPENHRTAESAVGKTDRQTLALRTTEQSVRQTLSPFPQVSRMQPVLRYCRSGGKGLGLSAMRGNRRPDCSPVERCPSQPVCFRGFWWT